MTSRLSWFVFVGFVLALGVANLAGQETPPAAAKRTPLKLKDAEVKELIGKLGVAKEAEREAAVKKLQAAGEPVIKDVAKVATNGNTKATENAIAILKAHVEGDDVETRVAAYGALRGLATILGGRGDVKATAQQIMSEHKDVKVEWEAEQAAISARRAERAKTNPAPAKTTTPAKPAGPEDPLVAIRRQAIEQQIKDGEASIEKIKKLKLPKDLEAQQISAVTLALQKLRADLRDLDKKPMRKK